MACINEYRDQISFDAESNLFFKGRIIWRDIATWIRTYLDYVYLNSDLEQQKLVIEMLMSIPIEYGNMIRIFFGDRIAEDYTNLLSNYIMVIINLINAQKNGDINALVEYTKQLYQNVEQRADFLSKYNPFWVKSVLQSIMYNFTRMTIDEVKTRFSKDYKMNINIFKRILTYSSVMGDYLAEGILNYLKYSARQPKAPK
jgi:hypothetical protein